MMSFRRLILVALALALLATTACAPPPIPQPPPIPTRIPTAVPTATAIRPSPTPVPILMPPSPAVPFFKFPPTETPIALLEIDGRTIEITRVDASGLIGSTFVTVYFRWKGSLFSYVTIPKAEYTAERVKKEIAKWIQDYDARQAEEERLKELLRRK